MSIRCEMNPHQAQSKRNKSLCVPKETVQKYKPEKMLIPYSTTRLKDTSNVMIIGLCTQETHLT